MMFGIFVSRFLCLFCFKVIVLLFYTAGPCCMLLAIAMVSIQMMIRPWMMAVIVALLCLPLMMGLARCMAVIAKVISNITLT